MSEPTNEELRQACERLRGQLYDVSLTDEPDLSRVLDFALSRLDREAEAEHRNADDRADLIRLATEAHERAERAIQLMLKSQAEKREADRLLKVAREALVKKIILGAHCDWDEGYNAGISEALAEIAPAAPEGMP